MDTPVAGARASGPGGAPTLCLEMLLFNPDSKSQFLCTPANRTFSTYTYAGKQHQAHGNQKLHNQGREGAMQRAYATTPRHVTSAGAPMRMRVT